MKVTLESTTRIVDITPNNGIDPVTSIQARVWEGTTESGIKVYALIPRIAAHKDNDLSQFERELKEQQPPSPAVNDVFPLRMVI